jgi:hypothetical protein
MTLWFFPVALVSLVALASLASVAVGGRFTPARDRRRHHRRPTPHRRCPACQIPAHRLPVVCGFENCPEVRPIKMTLKEYIEISDHLK